MQCAHCGLEIDPDEAPQLNVAITFVPGGPDVFPLQPADAETLLPFHLNCAEAGADKASDAVRQSVGRAAFARQLYDQQRNPPPVDEG